MELIAIIISGISAFAAVISAVCAVKARNKAQRVLVKFNNMNIANTGNNSGVISGINTGEIRNETKKH
jgi:hypothetical protein